VDREELGVLARFPAVPRRLLTVDEYHRMGEAGILTDNDRVELIEGELVAMAPIGSRHVGASNALTRLLVLAVGDRGVVSVQNPVRLTQHSEPQPDFAVLRPGNDYRTTLPGPKDTLLVVEVASSSLDYDRTVKLPLYARSGIPEAWIVNLAAGEVEIYRSPVGDKYSFMTRVGRTDAITITALPDVRVPVADIVG
jgi:Uma2 family endonuclease